MHLSHRGCFVLIVALMLAACKLEEPSALTPPDATPVAGDSLIVLPSAPITDVNMPVAFASPDTTVRGIRVSAPTSWSATGGTIDSSGVFVAATAGTFEVRAVRGTWQGQTKVTVIPGASVTAVQVSPATVSVQLRAVFTFSATGSRSDGTSIPILVNWSATGGIIDAAGRYTAGTEPGTYRVIATQRGRTLSDTAVVTVAAAPADLQAIEVTPPSVSLLSGGTQQFSAVGRMSDGSTTGVSVTWSATGGTVSAAGLYTAGGSAGSYRVIATQQGGAKADTAAITVTAPAPTLSAVELTPATVSLAPGGTQQFTAVGRMSDNSTAAVSVTYAATGGTITAGGLYAAGSTAGAFRVIATQQGGTKADTSAVTVTAPVPAPTVALSANPASVAPGAASTLTWSSTGATSCTASGAWSGGRPTSGSASTGALTSATSTFTLTCDGPGGSASKAVIVTVTRGGALAGLDFPGVNGARGTIRFRFTNPLAIYPATYIWKVYPRYQLGYYTTFFWGNDDGAGALTPTFWWDNGSANTYYGAHPYPVWPSATTHQWEIATDVGGDFVSSELVVYDRWYSQALIAWSDAVGKHTVFYWDLPDTTKVVVHVAPTSYGNKLPPFPTLTWGDAPWQPAQEIMNGVIRGIQIYSARLTVDAALSELAAPLSTGAGSASVWYMNLNPTPTDISDKSGAGHHPAWVGSERPRLWTGP